MHLGKKRAPSRSAGFPPMPPSHAFELQQPQAPMSEAGAKKSRLASWREPGKDAKFRTTILINIASILEK